MTKLLLALFAAAVCGLPWPAAAQSTSPAPAPAASAAPARPAPEAAAVPASASAPALRLPARPTLVTEVEGLSEYRLANGLQLLLVPDASKPTTTVNLTYHVGSRHENYGETGMAHLLEHLLFKGTPKNPQVWGEFTKRGLRANGSTSYDRTNYFASFAANDDNLRWYVDWLADSMVNSFIAKRDLDTEMTVVRNEMEMGENNPMRMTVMRGMASLFQWHNYGKPTIGARSDVENVDIGRLQAFYRRYYQPDNATLIVAGSFDREAVLRWVRSSFGRLAKPQRALPRLYTVEPVQDGERSYTLRRSGGSPLVSVGYRAPAAAEPDYAAVELLASILGDEPSGRLHRKLVEGQLAAGVWGWAWDLHDPGAVMFGAQLAPGQDMAAARAALLETIEGIAAEPVTAEELERARTLWLNAWQRNFNDPERVGVALSESVGQGDWRLYFLLRDRVRQLTLADVQRVANALLLPAGRNVGEYLPTEKPERAPAMSLPDVEAMVKGYTGDAVAAQAEVFDPTPANIEARTQRFDLASGMKVALLPKGSRGKAVQARLALRFGDAQSLAGHGEVPSLAAALLDRGTPSLSRQQIQDRLAALQATVSFADGIGSVNASIITVREQLPAVIELVATLLRESSFSAEALEEARGSALAGLQAQRQEPEALVANEVARHGNPYPRGDVRHARTFDELEADLKAATPEQLRAFRDRFYGASHAQFAASGDMDVAAVRSALEKGFGEWRSSEAYARVPSPLVEVAPETFTLRTPDKQNATMLTTEPLPLRDSDPDYAAFVLANRIFGQGGNSRLWARIREGEGLSYNVISYVDWNPFEANSSWTTEAIFAPQNRAKVETAFREELARALDNGFTARELDEAKKGLLAARRLQRSQDANLASTLLGNLYIGRTMLVAQQVDEAIGAAGLEQVNTALRRYLQPQRLVFGFGGDFKDTP